MLHGLSVDLEEYFQVSNFEGVIPRARWSRLASRVESPTRRLLDLFDAQGHSATFFVLGWVARRHAPLLREIRARGHEIACHGDGHERLDQLDPTRFREDLRRARAALEDATGVSPAGYRAPSFTVTPRSTWALPILAEEGFRYDSSVFPIRHPRYGWPGFPPRPVRLDLGGGRRLDEFPPTTARVGRVRLPVAGGAYLRFLPPALFRWGFRRATADGTPGLLYVHPWELDPEQPRQAVGWRVRLNHYHGLAATRSRLERLLRTFRFASLARVLAGLREADRLPLHRVEPASEAAAVAVPHRFVPQE